MIDPQNYIQLATRYKRAVWAMCRVMHNWPGDLHFPEVHNFEMAAQLHAEAKRFRQQMHGWYVWEDLADEVPATPPTEEYADGDTEEYET